MKRTILTLFAVLLLSCPAMAASTWQQVAQQMAVTAGEARSNADQTGHIITKERQAVMGEKSALKASVAARQQRFDALKAEYEGLLAREKALQEELAAQDHEFKTIDGAIRGQAGARLLSRKPDHARIP